ncbi:MAG: polysaccharide deacetylase family protein [Patescibacteria group bacterium]
MKWLSFLHFYQPANIESYSIKKALDKSYYRLLRLMEEHPSLKMTWNISGCLLVRLEDEKNFDFIKRLANLVKSGRVELTGSAAYHGFLPLLPESEVIRQIKENEKILKKYFGKKFKPTGFFLPEMAYSKEVASLVKRLGYKWLILDEFAYNGGKSRPNFTSFYIDKQSGLKIVFRNRDFSGAYPPDRILPELEKNKAGSETIITATDAELYGLRHEDPTAELEKIVKIKKLQTETISEFMNSLAVSKMKPEKINVVACSWESTQKEILHKEPFKLWQDKKNKIHNNLWKLTNLALSLHDKYKKDKNHEWYYWHLVRGIASCTFWWASAKDFSKIFGPYAWSPDGIERGLEDLIRSVRSLNDPKTKKYKLQAEKYYLKIKKLIWEEHWKKHWKKII